MATATIPTFLFFQFFVLSASAASRGLASPPPNDTRTLTLFRVQSDTHAALLSNWTGIDACRSSWLGVGCSSSGRVTALLLPSLSLRGTLDPLSSLDQLRILDVSGNRLNGSIFPITNCTNLKLLYVSGNDLSGEIPPEISSLRRLLRLDLSDNNIRGPIPAELASLGRLLTLRLENNLLSGEIPDLSASLPNLNELNVTNNELHGRVPDSMLKKFGQKSFAGNGGLCGAGPLPSCSLVASPPPVETVPSNPSSIPVTNISLPGQKHPNAGGLGAGSIAAIVLANCVALLVVTSFIVAYCCSRGNAGSHLKQGSESGKRRSSGSSDKRGGRSSYGGGGGTAVDSDDTDVTDRSKLVFFERKSRFELEDLLRASAEMLGKGSLGTVYKAALEDGSTVAVKRLKDANPCAVRAVHGPDRPCEALECGEAKSLLLR
ncbi:hypothetical protein SAY86_024517 [Trapa natans]|uniref:Leucine-rich repeat-containing N-terminal plant-type domain-containing protein n=1 Tax=Trapa natans TaxID=22666 RepID=A0AAN7M6S9_TRANT|nr:hypothetical protein SAY86_024517 [Trapa natans]